MNTEKTLVLVKPDGVQRSLVGEVVRRIEARGLQLVGMKFMQISPELAAQHYAEHQGKPFYAGLVSFITSSPVVAMVWQGADAVALVRATMGATNPVNAMPGTIRGDLAINISTNIVHGSDSPQRAAQEVALFFHEDELVQWTPTIAQWVCG